MQVSRQDGPLWPTRWTQQVLSLTCCTDMAQAAGHGLLTLNSPCDPNKYLSEPQSPHL